LKWLADACVDARLVEALQKAECDIRQLAPQELSFPDEDVLKIAHEEDRLLLTDDKDFGEWVVRRRRPVPGLIIVRIDPVEINLKILRVISLYKQLGANLRGKILIVGPAHHRLRPIETGN
jgi:predicted nuclease of predicted toxin-antitoxin system